MSLLNTCGALVDTLVYGAAVRKQPLNDEPVFIIGHPRTGTTHLHNLLSKDDRFVCATTFSVGFPSSCLCLRAIAPLMGLIMDNKRPMDDMALGWDTPQEDELAVNMMSGGVSPYMPLLLPRKEKSFRKYYRFLTGAVPAEPKKNDGSTALKSDNATRTRGGKAAASDDYCDPQSLLAWKTSFLHFLKKTQYAAEKGGTRKRLLLKSPVHTARVALLREMFPKATFIFVHRHPCAVFQSAAHMADAYYWQCYLQKPTVQDTQEFILYQGALLHRAYMEDISGVDEGRKTEVRFEDLDGDLLETVQKLYEDLGWREHFERTKPTLLRYQSSLKDFKKNAFTRELSAEAVAVVRRRWSQWFDDLGYQ